MGKFDGVLLVSDFDDTLYGSDFTVSPENVHALTYFVQEGGTFTVATGRAHATFAPVFSLAPGQGFRHVYWDILPPLHGKIK